MDLIDTNNSLAKKVRRRIFVLCILVLLLLFPQNIWKASADSTAGTIADSTTCSTFATNGNYYFDDYETHDYVNGFLELHLKVKTPYNDGRTWTRTAFYLYDANCNSMYQETSYLPHVAIDAGIQLYSVRFTSQTHYDLWNDENNTKEGCDACSRDINTQLTNGQPATSVAFYATIDGENFVRTDSFPILQPAPAKNPVLIIPGILGSELSYNNQIEWPNLAMMAVSDDAFMDNLLMDDSGEPLNQISVGNVIQNLNYTVGQFHYADGMINALEKQGYAMDKNIFLFPYDWRKDPKDLQSDLKAEIDKIMNLNPQQKVDVIAHSYGGLVLKNYIKATSDLRINKIIFVGVPHLGAPEAAHALIFGSDLGISILSGKEIYKLAQNMPMIYNLLPSQEYYKHNAGFFDDFTDLKNPTIAGYDSSKNMLIDLGKNLKLLNQAELSHTDDLDNMDYSKLPYHVYNITGCGEFTLKTINKMYTADPTFAYRALHGPKYRIEGDSGDGVVTVGSSQFSQGTQYYISGIGHSQLLSDSNSASALTSILSGNAPVGLGSFADTACSISGKLLSFSSDVNVTIKDHATGNVLKPRLDYSVIDTGGDQNIFIPSSKLSTYEVQVTEEDEFAQSPDVHENISVKNINTQNKPSTTYNYNDVNIGTASLNMNFPNDASGDQTLTDIGSGGDANNIPPSQELDGSYNQTSGSTTTTSTGNDSGSSAATTTTSSSTTESSTSNPSTTTTTTAQTNSPTNQQSTTPNLDLPASQNNEDAQNTNPQNQTSISMPSSSEEQPTDTVPQNAGPDTNNDSTVETQPETSVGNDAGKPQDININLNFPKQNSDLSTLNEQDKTARPQIIQTINEGSNGSGLWQTVGDVLKLIINSFF